MRSNVKTNRIRSTMALPIDVNLDDILWAPDWAELQLAKLANMKKKWAAQERSRQEHKMAALKKLVAADREWLKACAAKEEADRLFNEHIAKIQGYYCQSHAVEGYRELS